MPDTTILRRCEVISVEGYVTKNGEQMCETALWVGSGSTADPSAPDPDDVTVLNLGDTIAVGAFARIKISIFNPGKSAEYVYTIEGADISDFWTDTPPASKLLTVGNGVVSIWEMVSGSAYWRESISCPRGPDGSPAEPIGSGERYGPPSPIIKYQIRNAVGHGGGIRG